MILYERQISLFSSVKNFDIITLFPLQIFFFFQQVSFRSNTENQAHNVCASLCTFCSKANLINASMAALDCSVIATLANKPDNDSDDP
mmetsp:Transcript_25437/g.51327  ORF Transcript_25437/g.51327 Transcript_25437/m.51327 type:complete len:88 (+) Transcript_25437:165-428(+)